MRLKQSRSIIVNYGLKNDGAEKISERLEKQEKREQKTSRKFKNPKTPVGISIAKTNCALTADTEEGIKDYAKAYKIFVSKNIGDYYTINISCPNAYGGQPFTEPKKLDSLLNKIVVLSA